LAQIIGLKTLLQLTSVTESFGVVRMLKGVSFDLRAGDDGQPGGLPEISRGLRVATPPKLVRKTSRTPEGCQNHRAHVRAIMDPNLWHPFRVHPHCARPPGGVVALCTPQPPAKFCETSGLVLPHRIQNADHT